MRMRHDNVADVLVRANSVKDRRKMRVAIRAGVNHGQASFAQQISVGTAIGHGRRVRGDNPAQAEFKDFGGADGGIEVIRGLHRLTFRLER